MRFFEPPPLPDGPWDVIYADCPWYYEFSKSKSRSIEAHYPPMKLEDICALPVKNRVPKDAVLFNWATKTKLEEAFAVTKAWGFKVRTHIIWDKVTPGKGYWNRDRHELLLICIRGNFPPPPVDLRVPSIITIKREGRHSKKPDWFRDHVARITPGRRRLEMFAREEWEGFTPWGNEVRQKTLEFGLVS